MTQRNGSAPPRRGRTIVVDGVTMQTLACQACGAEISWTSYQAHLGDTCIGASQGLIVRWWCGCDGASATVSLSFDRDPSSLLH